MFGKKKQPPIKSLIAQGTRIQGDLQFGEGLRIDGGEGNVVLRSAGTLSLTQANDSSTQADYIVVEMAKHLLGDNWMKDYVDNARNGGIERVLL